MLINAVLRLELISILLSVVNAALKQRACLAACFTRRLDSNMWAMDDLGGGSLPLNEQASDTQSCHLPDMFNKAEPDCLLLSNLLSTVYHNESQSKGHLLAARHKTMMLSCLATCCSAVFLHCYTSGVSHCVAQLQLSSLEHAAQSST